MGDGSQARYRNPHLVSNSVRESETILTALVRGDVVPEEAFFSMIRAVPTTRYNRPSRSRHHFLAFCSSCRCGTGGQA